LGIWGNPKGLKITETEGDCFTLLWIRIRIYKELLRVIRGLFAIAGFWFTIGTGKLIPTTWISSMFKYGSSYGIYLFIVKLLTWANIWDLN
jgi:hypothetical protein